MYKKVLCIITAFMLSTNMAFASPKDSIKDIDQISNSSNTLFLSVLQNNDMESVEKEMNFIQSELDRERNYILDSIEGSEDKDKVIYYSLLSTLNFYQIALLQLQIYYKNNNSESLLSAIKALNEGNSMLDIIKARV